MCASVVPTQQLISTGQPAPSWGCQGTLTGCLHTSQPVAGCAFLLDTPAPRTPGRNTATETRHNQLRGGLQDSRPVLFEESVSRTQKQTKNILDQR